MKYRDINIAITEFRDISKSIRKDKVFYDYLLGNSVAYFYSKQLAKNKNITDREILILGEKLNRKFIKTLKLINDVCKKNQIRFLLFKTYKYIPEVVDNDIDIFIKYKDFYKFMKIFKLHGFYCIENEPLKGICLKEGFCKIEPRVSIAFRGKILLNEKKIWNNTESVRLVNMHVFKTIKEVDLFHFLLSILYNPNYFKLYTYILYKICNKSKLYKLSEDSKIKEDLSFLIRNLFSVNLKSKRFPLFLDNLVFVNWWYKRIYGNKDIFILEKIKLIMSFFYIKYLYLIFNKLAFKRFWL